MIWHLQEEPDGQIAASFMDDDLEETTVRFDAAGWGLFIDSLHEVGVQS